MRRAFQITLLLAASIPFALGAVTLVQGAVRFVPPDVVTAMFDGQVRFWGIRSMLPFFVTIWIVCNLENAETVLVIIALATAADGLARVVSAIQFGALEPAVVGVIAFEIGVLLFIPWYRAVVRRTDTKAHA